MTKLWMFLILGAMILNSLWNPVWAATKKSKKAVPEAVVEEKVQSYTSLLERAADLYKRGKITQAIVLYRKAEERGADASLMSFNIGNAYYVAGDLSKSAAAFKRSLRLSDKPYVPAQFNLAAVLYRLGQYGESIALYHQALKQDPSNASAWIFLAEAYTKTGDAIGALRALEKAQDLDPDDLTLSYQMAEVHVSLKEYDPAIALVKNAYLRNPKEVDFLFYIGDLQRLKGDLVAAANSYREGLMEKPDNVAVMYKLADVLAQDKKEFLAMDYLNKALIVKPDFVDAAVFLGNMASDLKWWDRAQSAYVLAAQKGSGEGVQGLRNLAYEFEKTDFKTALSYLLLAQKYAPTDRSIMDEIRFYREQIKSMQ